VTRGRVQDVRVAVASRRKDGVLCEIVRAAAAEHEGVHAHSHVASLRLDALPHEHACAVQAVHRTRLRTDLVACNIMGTANFRIAFLNSLPRSLLGVTTEKNIFKLLQLLKTSQ
jgi:hypothetical protein